MSARQSLSSCDARGVVSRAAAGVICYRGGEEVESVRESVNHTTQISRVDEVERQSEKGCVFVAARVTCFHLFCVVATANGYSFGVCRYGARDSASDCSFRI